MDLDENILLEVFKRVDMKTLMRAACVNKHWYTTAENEQLRRMRDTVETRASSTAASSVVDPGTAPQTPSLQAASATAASEDNSPTFTES